MIFVYESGVAFVLVTVTLWLQAGGIAVLIAWVRHVTKNEIHKSGLLRSASLVVRFTTALVGLQALQILLWASCYRWLCFPSWESAVYFSASSYATVGYGDVTLPLKWRMLGPLEGVMGVLMCGISVSLLLAIATRLVGLKDAYLEQSQLAAGLHFTQVLISGLPLHKGGAGKYGARPLRS